jgi:hypothetical protein
VYVSRDSGASWQPTGFANNVQFNTLTAVGPYLYAGSLYRHALADFYPAASVAKTISSTGSYQFDDLSGTTGVTLNITSLNGAAAVTVYRFKDPPANPAFTATPPVNLSQYRWVIDGSEASVTGEIRISLSAFSTGVVNPGDVHIYKRSTSGTGAFTELPTTYDAGTNEIVAAINGFSEFALGSGSDLLGVGEGRPRIPGRFELGQNYPNPFNPATVIGFGLESRSIVTLRVFDLLGREVATLLKRQPMEEGPQQVSFSAGELPSGVYLYRLEVEARPGTGSSATVPARSIVRKMVLVK